MERPGTNFKRWRKQCKFTQAEAARLFGVSKTQIEYLDAGISRTNGAKIVPSLAERTFMAVCAQQLPVDAWPE